MLQTERVFIDMDGVLAKFQKEKDFEDLYTPGYFLNLLAQENILRGIKNYMFFCRAMCKSIDFYILSSYLEDHPTALTEKNIWLNQHFSAIPTSDRIFIKCGESKANAINLNPDTDILIDDYGKNCRDWSEKGGTYIKVSDSLTDMKRERFFHEFVIAPDEGPEKIADIIDDAVNSLRSY